MLKLKNVSKFYYNKGIIATGFSKVNLELKIGEFVAITGESGSGKSTLLNVISGLDSYEEGEMYINGEETSHYTEKEFEDYRRKYIANIFQNFNLINSYTVYQNVELVLLLNGYKKSKIKKKVLEMIDQVGLTKFKNTKVSKLSGGQKQRVAIARAMVKETPIIVADEPTGNLDTESAKDVIEILKKVAKDKLVVIVTHNIEQVEQYATRIIKMNDGRIVEDREIKKINDEQVPNISKYNKITISNRYRLGIRNTFNIKTKFILLFAVFLFISLTLMLEYGGFQQTEESYNNEPSNAFFEDLSDNRIIIKNEDKSGFSEEEYNQIKLLTNIDYIVEDDIFTDTEVRITRNSITAGYLSFSATLNDYTNFRGDLDIGKFPENDNEIILVTSRDMYGIKENLDEVLDKSFFIDGTDSIIEQLKVVGIKYNENDNNYNSKIYMSPTQLEKLRIYVFEQNSTLITLFNDEYYTNEIIPSENVEQGQVIVNDEWKYNVSNNKIKGKDVNISIENLYYTDELNLKIRKTFTKNNFTKLTGYDQYEKYQNCIFVNKDDYESLFNKDSYQSSVYVKDVNLIDETIKQLNEMGINTKKISDYKVDVTTSDEQIFKIMRTIVTIILIIILFFISYFIIRIVLKSRNIYYTTLRMLGATYDVVKRILDIELFINSSIAYVTSVVISEIIKNKILKFKYLPEIFKYIGTKEYVIIYIILVIMAEIISRKVSKHTFKNTAINTYNEEV